VNVLPEPNEHDLADCLSNLRKSFTHRLGLIEKYYSIRAAIDNPQKKRHLAELLAEVGIIRPLMLKALLDVRNDVEYNDVKPPSVERCREFAEAVWYLLRSTDSILEIGRTDVSFSKEGDWHEQPVCWFSLDIEYKPKFKLSLRGNFGPLLLSREQVPKSMELEAEFPTKNAADIFESEGNGAERFVMGVLNLALEERKAVLRAAFEAVST